MSDREKLLKAAEVLDETVKALEVAEGKIAEAQSEAQQAKVAAEEAKKQAGGSKTASTRDEVAIGQLAKAAAEKIRDAGLLSTKEAVDKFASQITDHEAALTQLAKLAGFAQAAPRQGQVVVDDATSDVETADSHYEKRASAVLHRLNLG